VQAGEGLIGDVAWSGVGKKKEGKSSRMKRVKVVQDSGEEKTLCGAGRKMSQQVKHD